MQFQVNLPRHLTASDRQEVGQAIIRKIKLRTLEGVDLDGKPFANYSKRYTESKDFKLAGKSSSEVDLRFTHEMMDSLEVLSVDGGSVTIGFTNEAAGKKAEWAEASDNGPSRKFMGVTDKELSSILSQHAAPTQATRGLAEEVLKRIFSFGQ